MRRGFNLAEGATHVAQSVNFVNTLKRYAHKFTHVAQSKSCRKTAFTLAEVLITLGIIGVVAAMTMPTLIQNHQKQVYVTGAKKAVNILDNMFRQMMADDDVTEFANSTLVSNGYCAYDWNTGSNQNGCEDMYGNPSMLEKLVPKYLKVLKSCIGSDCDPITYKHEFSIDSNYKVSKRSTAWDETIGPKYNFGKEIRFYTVDGMRFSFSWDENQVNINFDTNGDKAPNVHGRDVFEATYCFNKDKQRIFYGFNHDYCANSSYTETPDFLKYMMKNGWKMDY